MRAVAALVASAAAVVVLGAGCSHGAGAATPAGPAATTGDLGSQLDQLQSTLDSVSAQVGADSAP